MKTKHLPPIFLSAAADAGSMASEREKGLAAYQQEDYKAAFDHFKTAAEQGHGGSSATQTVKALKRTKPRL